MKNKKIELIGNTIIIFLGKACTQLISFLLLPLYTKYLITQDYGMVDLIMTYVSLLVPVLTLQLEMAVFRFLVDKRENVDEQNKIISSGILFLLFIIVNVIIVYLVISRFINVNHKNLIVLVIISTMFSSLLLQITRGLGDNLKYSIGCSISGISTVILNVIFIVVFKTGVKGMMYSMIISNMFCSIYIFISANLYNKIKVKYFSEKLIKKFLKYSIPLVPNGISWWIVNASDRSIVSKILGVGANGIYAVSNKFSSLFIGVFNVFLLSWTESVSLHIDDYDRDDFFSNIINNVLRIFISIGSLIIGLLPLLFKLLIDEKYLESYLHIPILIIAMIFNILVGLYSAFYIAKKQTKQVMYTSLYSAVINIFINLILIRKIGLYAGSISTLIAYAVMAIYRIIDIHREIKIKLEYRYITLSILFYLIIIYFYYNVNFYYKIILVMLTIAFTIISNRKILLNILKKAKKSK